MLYIIAGIIVGMIFAYYDDMPKILGALEGFIIGLIVWIIVGGIVGAFCPTYVASVSSTEIYSLKDSSTIDGSFFLGCGTVDEDKVYYYMAKTDKGLLMSSVEASGAYIKETDGVPRIEKNNYDFTSDWFYLIALPISTPKECTIYVPYNTVINTYSIDLEG